MGDDNPHTNADQQENEYNNTQFKNGNTLLI